MTVTIEVINQQTLNLLRDMEDMGLIQMKTPGSQTNTGTAKDSVAPYNWLRGCCKNLPGGSVNDFLKRSHTDKDREFAIERRSGTSTEARSNKDSASKEECTGRA